MSDLIHPTAIIEPGAQLGEGVRVGAYAYIGANVKIGRGTVVQHHASIEGNTTIGENCEFFSFACIGKKTQDLKYDGGTTYVQIGDRCVFREFTTVNSGTRDGEVTKIGSDCLIMTYTHIAHGCALGNHIIISNCCQIAGEVTIEDYVTIGGMSGVHQFARIGCHAMLGGMTAAKQDVAPYMIVDGATEALTRGVNLVGLHRRGFKADVCAQLKEAYRLIYREGLNRSQAIERIELEMDLSVPELRNLVEFYKSTRRGVL